MGVSFITLRVCTAHASPRRRIDGPLRKANADKLIAQLKDQCAAHEASAGFPEAERYVEKDAALIFPAVLTHHLAKLHMVNFRAHAPPIRRARARASQMTPSNVSSRYTTTSWRRSRPTERSQGRHQAQRIGPWCASAGRESAGGHAPAAPAAAARRPALHRGRRRHRAGGVGGESVPPVRDPAQVHGREDGDARGAAGDQGGEPAALGRARPAALPPVRCRLIQRGAADRGAAAHARRGAIPVPSPDAPSVRVRRAAAQGGEGRRACPVSTRSSRIEGVTFPDELGVARATVRSGLVDFGSLAEMFIPGPTSSTTARRPVSSASRSRAASARATTAGGSHSSASCRPSPRASSSCRSAISSPSSIAPAHPEFQGTRSIIEGFETSSCSRSSGRLTRGDQYCKVATGHAYVEHRARPSRRRAASWRPTRRRRRTRPPLSPRRASAGA